MSMAMKYGMMKRAKGGCSGPDCTGCSSPSCMAAGGMVEDEMASGFQPPPKPGADKGEEGIVDRIMQRFAKGGEVEPMADFESNDFDELDKDMPPEDADTGANSGDELGDKTVEDEDEDTTSKVMKSRKKGDRMPRPA